MVTANEELAPKHVCPECGYIAIDPPHLGIHRSFKHGIRGTSKQAVTARKKRQASKAQPRSPVTREEQKRMVQMRKEGRTWSEISQATGRVSSVISRAVERAEKHETLNHPRRPVGRPRMYRKHACPECGERFFRPQDLGRHRQATHGVQGISRMSLYKRQKENQGEHDARTRSSESAPSLPTPDATDQAFEREVSYCFGHTQSWLDSYAQSIQVPSPLLTRAVAELLLRKAGRKVLGT